MDDDQALDKLAAELAILEHAVAFLCRHSLSVEEADIMTTPFSGDDVEEINDALLKLRNRITMP